MNSLDIGVLLFYGFLCAKFSFFKPELGPDFGRKFPADPFPGPAAQTFRFFQVAVFGGGRLYGALLKGFAVFLDLMEIAFKQGQGCQKLRVGAVFVELLQIGGEPL